MDQGQSTEGQNPEQAFWMLRLSATPLEFCLWLDGWITSLNNDIPPMPPGLLSERTYFRYELSPYLDLIRDSRRSYQPFDLAVRVTAVYQRVNPPRLGATSLETKSELSEAAYFLDIHETDGETSVKVVCEPTRAMRLEDIVKAIYEKWPQATSPRRHDSQEVSATLGGAAAQPGRLQSFPGARNDSPSEGDMLPAVDAVKRFYAGYNPETALRLLNNLPAAWKAHTDEGGKWGPRFVATRANLNATTTGRYLNALKRAGLKTWLGVPLP